jgi:hypothetical protein
VTGKALTTNVEYQGFPCSPLFEVRRSVGLDPDYCFVHVAKQDLGKIVIQDPPGGFDKALDFLADLSAPTGVGKLYRVGDLLLQDLKDLAEGASVRFRKMLLDEGTIESVAATDGDSSGLVRIGLTDIRKLWEDQGFVHTWINIPRQSTFVDPLADPLATVDRQRFVPGSTDGDQAWTIRRVLEQVILPRLPGKPPLKGLSESLESRESGPHYWEAPKRAKEAFRELLAEVDAVCALNPDSSVSVWRRGDGELQDLDGGSVALDDDGVATQRLMLSHRVSVPDTVMVVGRPIVETVTEELVAVGEVAFPGGQAQLLPLARALAMTNVPPEANPKAILLEHDRRRAAGVDDGAALGFEKWGFRWFCLRSFLGGKKTQVPVEACAETDSDGQRLPPVVRATSVRATSVHIEAAISAGIIKRLSGPGGGSLIPDNVDLRTLDPSNGKVIFNVPPSLQGDGAYRIDVRRGLVEFFAPRVQVTKDGVAIAEAEIAPAKVTLTFGVSRKPAPDQPLKLSDRYVSAWRYVGSRGIESEDLKRVADELGKSSVEKVSDEDFARLDLSRVVAVEADLQLLVTLDKRDNRAVLDSIAQKLAEPLILANRFTPGSVVELVGIASIRTTGRILSVIWKGDVNSSPTTTAHDGLGAPFRAQARPLSLEDVRRGATRVGVESVGSRALGYLPGARGL